MPKLAKANSVSDVGRPERELDRPKLRRARTFCTSSMSLKKNKLVKIALVEGLKVPIFTLDTIK